MAAAGSRASLIGAAALVKFFPLVIFPALWRRWRWPAPAALVAVVVAGYALYASAGMKVLGFLSGYSDEEGIRSGAGFWYAQLVQRLTGVTVPPSLYVAGVALLLAGVGLVVFLSQNANRHIGGALALASTGMVGLSPSHPWYFLWLAPFLCLAPSAPLLWLIAVSPVLYWPNPYDVPWNRDVLYGGFTLLALASLLTSRLASRGE